jgi:hypothetical protein
LTAVARPRTPTSTPSGWGSGVGCRTTTLRVGNIMQGVRARTAVWTALRVPRGEASPAPRHGLPAGVSWNGGRSTRGVPGRVLWDATREPATTPSARVELVPQSNSPTTLPAPRLPLFSWPSARPCLRTWRKRRRRRQPGPAPSKGGGTLNATASAEVPRARRECRRWRALPWCPTWPPPHS